MTTKTLSYVRTPRLRAWKVTRDEDWETVVVVAEDLEGAVAMWRERVREQYDLTDVELAEEQPNNVELLCERGEVLLPPLAVLADEAEGGQPPVAEAAHDVGGES